jgi:hypothetical protein
VEGETLGARWGVFWLVLWWWGVLWSFFLLRVCSEECRIGRSISCEWRRWVCMRGFWPRLYCFGKFMILWFRQGHQFLRHHVDKVQD